MTGDDMAIQVAGVHKSYGRGARKTEVLRNFNMTIPKGHIYGLLGKIIYSSFGSITLALSAVCPAQSVLEHSIFIFPFLSLRHVSSSQISSL